MSNNKLIRCPHCHDVAEVVWIGFGKEWVMCDHCQRRIRWMEVETKYLLRDAGVDSTEAENEASYH